jgi:hypothetical protein
VMETVALRARISDVVPVRSVQNLSSPPITVELANCNRTRICIVREDLLPGGTKQRAAAPYLAQKLKAGFRSFAYASPFAGFAQVALAQAARMCGVELHLFCEAMPAELLQNSEPGLQAHEFTKLAQSFGATVSLFQDLDSAKMAANNFAEKDTTRFQIPLGLNDSIFRTLMRTELLSQWNWLKQTSNLPIRTVWVSLGSGTLAGILAEVVGPATRVVAVDVGVLDESDERILKIRSIPNVEYVRLSVPFSSRAHVLPPCPSNMHYDAKLWSLINEKAEPYDVWWNVAR